MLTGKKKKHKKYVYGIQTTRGIIKGSDHYGIRTIRSKKFRYIINLTPETKFEYMVTNSYASGGTFYRSWIAKAKTDPAAVKLVHNFQFRLGVELYNVVEDPLELNNLGIRKCCPKEKIKHNNCKNIFMYNFYFMCSLFDFN